MKKIVSIALCACFVCMFIKADALPKRVGYYGNQIAGQDFTSLQAAHDASNAGDTLLIFPGSWVANFSKKLVVIGYGYFLKDSGANVDVQAINKTVSVKVFIYSNAKGCIFEGLDNFALLTAYESNGLDSLRIRRCRVQIELNGVDNELFSNWEITQSFVISIYGVFGTQKPNFQKLLVQNCFISNIGSSMTNGGATVTGTFNNNVFGTGTINFFGGDFLLKNNIFLGASTLGETANLEYKNNIASNNIIPSGNGNKPTVDITKVFVGYPNRGNYSFDERYKIKTNGPAHQAGEDGDDCGMFGGPDPYRLSGIPRIPAFYKLTAPSSTATSNPYTITFSVRGNN